MYTASGNIGVCPASGSGYAGFYPNPIVNLGNDTTICEGDTITLVAGDTSRNYEWSNWSTSPLYDVWGKGEYSVKVTDKQGCISFDTIMIATLNCDTIQDTTDTSDTTTSIIHIPFNTGFKLYPIPADNELVIEALTGNRLSYVAIIDMKGNIAMEREISTSYVSLNVSELQMGQYILLLKDKNSHSYRKRIVIR